MPMEAHFTDPNPPGLRAKSIISRFSSPLSKRSRNIYEFEIEPDDPFKTYSPGDIVRGRIILSVFKGFDITHLVIALHGFAKVYKHQCVPGEGRVTPDVLVNGKGSRGFEYHGNGLVSLFQDEQTLCGSGFLKRQVYQFGFELQFPTSGLPSTIDFERGTVAYMISATVTRPTTIAPTTTKTARVLFTDRIDIESMYTPKSRAISLEPIVRRGKVKKVKQASSVSTQETSTKGNLSRQNTHATSQTRSTAPSHHPPLSPAPSEDTVATHATASTQEFNMVEVEEPVRKHSPNTSEAHSSATSSSAHTITATTEIPRFGALPGDLLPIKITVSHTKPARGAVIATLFRQGRIDMHPVLRLANKGKNGKAEYEDVYPKSKTGLGGLYFATSSPNSVFRKDLSQTSTMMRVDPSTLSADIRMSIKIPDNTFPSIQNVPGGMITFTYHLEVVIDLTGKLGEARILPSLTSNGPTFTAAADTSTALTSEWANNILDTSAIRRTKSVATFEFPLVIGTLDSSRSKLKDQHPNLNGSAHWHGKETFTNGHAPSWNEHGQEYYDYNGEYYDYGGYDENYYDGYWYDEQGNPVENGWQEYDSLNGGPDHDWNLMPPPEQEEEVDEKTRLRRQEELLLPSQPPQNGESSHSAQAPTPSAPSFDEGAAVSSSRHQDGPQSSIPITISRASANSADTVIPDPMTPPPSLPEDQFSQPTEDKQELERRRLLAQASAPPTDGEGEGARSATGESSSQPSAPPPSAPVIDEDEEYTSQTLQQEGSDHLPEYQR